MENDSRISRAWRYPGPTTRRCLLLGTHSCFPRLFGDRMLVLHYFNPSMSSGLGKKWELDPVVLLAKVITAAFQRCIAATRETEETSHAFVQSRGDVATVVVRSVAVRRPEHPEHRIACAPR
jgi:hypothetical protein